MKKIIFPIFILILILATIIFYLLIQLFDIDKGIEMNHNVYKQKSLQTIKINGMAD